MRYGSHSPQPSLQLRPLGIPQPPTVPYEPAQIPERTPMGLSAAHPRQPRSSTSRIQSRLHPRAVVGVIMSVASAITSVASAITSVVSVIMSAINELHELPHSEGATRRGPQRLHKAIRLRVRLDPNMAIRLRVRLDPNMAIRLRVRLDRSKYGSCGWVHLLKCMQLDAIARLVVLIRWLEDRRKYLMRATIRCNQRSCNQRIVAST
jgi:hypothetical protein